MGQSLYQFKEKTANKTRTKKYPNRAQKDVVDQENIMVIHKQLILQQNQKRRGRPRKYNTNTQTTNIQNITESYIKKIIKETLKKFIIIMENKKYNHTMVR